MRRIEKRMINAIYHGKDWKENNTEVRITHEGETAKVYLHGNRIAKVDLGTVIPDIRTFSRWPTATTCSRLRALGIRCKSGNKPELFDLRAPFP